MNNTPKLTTFFEGADHSAMLLQLLQTDPVDSGFETIWSNISERNKRSILQLARKWNVRTRALEEAGRIPGDHAILRQTVSYDLHVACAALGFEVQEFGGGYLLIPGTPCQIVSGSFDTAEDAYNEDIGNVIDANVLRLRVYLESKMRRVS